jgi:hypothetical protein
MRRPSSVQALAAVNALGGYQSTEPSSEDLASIHGSYTRGLSYAKKKMINTIVPLPNLPAPFARVVQESIIVIPSQWRRIPNTIRLCSLGRAALIQDAGA